MTYFEALQMQSQLPDFIDPALIVEDHKWSVIVTLNNRHRIIRSWKGYIQIRKQAERMGPRGEVAS